MTGENNKANSTNEDSFGDLTIKDLTGVTTNNSFSEKTSPPTCYVESAKGGPGQSYSHQELDSSTYPSLVPAG